MAVIRATFYNQIKLLLEKWKQVLIHHRQMNICQFGDILTGFIWAGPLAASAPNEGIEEAIGPRGVSARADFTTYVGFLISITKHHHHHHHHHHKHHHHLHQNYMGWSQNSHVSFKDVGLVVGQDDWAPGGFHHQWLG